MTARRSPEPPCPNAAEHTPAPADYLGWFSWAERMNRTHDQRRCEGCGRWAIWYRRPPGLGALCWGCGEARVDPARFGPDEVLVCADCVRERAEQGVRSAREWTRRRWAEAT